MALGLSPRESTMAADQLQQLPTAVIPPVSTGEMIAENLAAPGGGILAGGASAYQALKGLGTNFGAMGGYDPETGSVVEETPEVVQRQQAIDSVKMVQQFAPDPRRSGAAAQVLHGLFSTGTQMIGGTLLTGAPFGGAAVVAASAGVDTRNEIYAATGDKDVADKLALGSAMFAGGGAMLPGGVGKTLMTRMLSGTGIQLTAGIANRTMMHVGLEDAGYTQMAKQYMPLDGAGMMADAVLGATFGLVHHAFAPALVDSAHAIKDAEQVERAAGGPAVSPEARESIINNETAAAEALIHGRDLTGTRDVETVPDAAQDAARATALREADSAAAEAGARPVELPVEPERAVDILGEAKARVESEQAAPPPEGAKPAETDLLAQIDPADREVLQQAQEVLARNEGMKIGGQEGDIAANDALRRAIDDIKQSAGEDDLHRVAAACFGRV